MSPRVAPAWLVVGLGNPGPRYAKQRHNVGFRVIDELAQRSNLTLTASRKMSAEVGSYRLRTASREAKLILVKPQTFMNDSGQAVRRLADFHRVAPGQLIVVHDELDLSLGQLRLKLGGSDNGHNGLKSVRAHLGSGDFYRVRFGIGRPTGSQPAAGYVLSDFRSADADLLGAEVMRAADATEDLVTDGLAAAQSSYNS